MRGIKRPRLYDMGKVRRAQCSTHPLMISECSVLEVRPYQIPGYQGSYVVLPELGTRSASHSHHMMTNTGTRSYGASVFRLSISYYIVAEGYSSFLTYPCVEQHVNQEQKSAIPALVGILRGIFGACIYLSCAKYQVLWTPSTPSRP